MQRKMKTNTTTWHPAYPNSARPDYYIQKLLDIATGIVSGIGLFVSILFLVSLT